MLRRKIKRRRESSENEDNEVSLVKKYGRRAVREESVINQDLEKLVFGNQHFLDLSTDVITEDNLVHSEHEENSEQAKAPAWRDEDDCNLSIDIAAEHRLKKFRDGGSDTITGDVLKNKLETQFKKLYGVPAWASDKIKDSKATGNDEDRDDTEILQRTGNMLSAKSDYLPRGVIDIARMKDANCSKPMNATVKCLEFHPNSKILLTAGLNNTLSIFQVKEDILSKTK